MTRLENLIPVAGDEMDADHMLGRVHSTDSFGTVDGPGTRFVVFLQGCLYRCLYCHNRDTWDLNAGELRSVGELVEEIVPYQPFMEMSEGGVTVTGGEPLLQAQFVYRLFKSLKHLGFHTCLDTNGYAVHYDDTLDALLGFTDLVMLDIKQINPERHKALVGVSNQYALKFARYLAEREKKVWIRYVVVPGYSDDLDDADELARFVAQLGNVEKVELLPFHQLGEHKWKELGEEYALNGVTPPSSDTMKRISAIFNSYGLATGEY
ncbi:pyruvate formate-lyase-activating protein [Gynuella sp.]|uniref:pyruvate formate-lyase-activating protein n=1 Tax=Gynuella sp. TaxID=2969146 RepID=UPI003D1228F1